MAASASNVLRLPVIDEAIERIKRQNIITLAMLKRANTVLAPKPPTLGERFVAAMMKVGGLSIVANASKLCVF